ncbi:MAG: MFS transporter [Lactobacillus sp.]|jgi:MFS family permease|nr:MFS transporter [Lactobacillus sp.]
MRRWLGVVILGLFFFMVIVDGSIVTIAIPAMSQALHVGTERVNLVISVYLVTISALLLPFGQLGAAYGRERVFQVGTLGFLLGSWLAGASDQLPIVLTGRVLQGIGASMTMANSYALVTDWFPPQQLGRAFGVESIFISIGGLAGPGLGGLVLTHWDWRYIFWLNLPIGLVCLVAEWGMFPKSHPAGAPQHFDWGGAVALLGLASSFYIGTANLMTRPLVAGVGLVLFAGLLRWFVRHEAQAPVPLLRLPLLTSPEFGLPLWAAFTTFVAAYFFTLLAPIYLQLVVHLSSQTTGLVLMGGPLLAVVVNPLAGVVADRWSQPRVMVAGMWLLVASTLGLVALNGALEPGALLILSLVLATGTSFFGTANSAYIMGRVPSADRGAAGAINSLLRELGLVLGATLASASFYGGLSAVSGRAVLTASGQSAAALLAAQRLAYLVAAAILIVGWRLSRLLVRREGTH